MKIKTYQWAILTLTMVLVALFFGLLHRGWPVVNDIQWLPDSRAIRFGNSGMAYVDDLRAFRVSRHSEPLTIEMAVTPANNFKSGFRPLLVVHDGVDRRQLAIWQYNASLVVMNGDDYDSSQRRPRVVGRDVFSSQRTIYLTITSDELGTHLYVDGILAAANSNWKLSIPVEGEPLRLVLGHSVYGRHGWRGDIHGLALAGEAISAEAVRLRFDRWAADQEFDALKLDSTMLLFPFNQKTDRGFVDASGGNQTLALPDHITVLKKTFLSSPWPHFYWSRAVTSDMVVNVIGFVPLGIVFYGFVQSFSGRFTRHNQLLAVALCLLLSLGIELAQTWIPTRHSSLPDLILNTFGAWLGIVGWRVVHKVRARSTNLNQST
jgi:glycopeptide antibiotics resistance protein